MRVGRHGIADALRAQGAMSASEWTARRSALVARTRSTLFIDNEVAAWAVDSWAVAFGVISQEALHQQRALHAGAMVKDSATPRPANTPRRRRAAATPHLHGAGNLAPVPGAPSWAGGQRSTRVGVAYTNTGRRVRTGWRGSSGPVHVPNVRRNLLVLGVVLALAMLLAMLSQRALTGDQAASVAAADSHSVALLQDSVVQAAADSAVESTAVRDAIGDVSIGNASIGNALPRTLPPPRVPTLTPGNEFAPLGALDTIRLHDGRTLIGSIRLVAPGALFVHDVRSGLEYTMPYSEIRSVTTRIGRAMPLPLAASDDPAAVNAALLERGVGGTYHVEQRVQSVDGSSTCDAVAGALGSAAIRSVEEFSHAPGSREFVLISRPGVRGNITEQARFASAPHAAERNGVRFVFRMSGYFTPGGFVARAITETEANIRYRQTQRCRIVADLLGTKSVPGTDDSASGEPRPPLPR